MPVLSEQIAEVEPRVSTAGSRFTIALRRAISRVPIESRAVTTAGSPVGMAAADDAMRRDPDRKQDQHEAGQADEADLDRRPKVLVVEDPVARRVVAAVAAPECRVLQDVRLRRGVVVRGSACVIP